MTNGQKTAKGIAGGAGALMTGLLVLIAQSFPVGIPAEIAAAAGGIVSYVVGQVT